ncbi:MAG: head-tail adaptor protein [Thermaurantiacus sp.]
MGAELAGRLRQRLRFERRQEIPDGAGGIGNHWTLAAEVWGELRPEGRGPASLLDADSRVSVGRWRILVRNDLPLTLDMRVMWRGLVMRLTGIELDPVLPDRVVLMAEEIGPRG